MSIVLDCRIDRDGAGTALTLPYAAVERAYMLLDALMCGDLHRLSLRSGSMLLACRCGEEDALGEGALTLSRATAAQAKALLLHVALHPQDASWLHVDAEAAGGDVVIRVESI